jgi:radical SAM/Cys-rich protein
MAAVMRLPLAPRQPAADFDATLAANGCVPLSRAIVTTLQVNVGKLCNMACHHCHVDAGPKRTEVMTRDVVDQILRVLEASPEVATVDITGGAPELNPSFRYLVTEARRRGRDVIDRCNLSVLFEPGQSDLADFFARHGVRVVASLPCYTAENVDAQRGRGAFEKSVTALLLLNAIGYGQPGWPLELDLVYNPGGPFLPPSQASLEARYRRELATHFGISFHRLLTIANMPIARFAHALEREGKHDAYVSLLVNHFNPGTVPGLMCRSLVSVAWDGKLHDCDFNQMLELPLGLRGAGAATTIWGVSDLGALRGTRIRTGTHCFGCTAGAGSSCSGAVT